MKHMITKIDKKTKCINYILSLSRNEVIDIVDNMHNLRMVLESKQTKLEIELLNILIEK